MSSEYICPQCKTQLNAAEQCYVCKSCQEKYPVLNECTDFVRVYNAVDQEHEYYEKKYCSSNISAKKRKKSTKYTVHEYIETIWFNPCTTSLDIMLSHMGDLSGKDVLCIRNGRSVKEIYLAKRGARLCITDLSFNAILHTRELVKRDYAELPIQLHAVDAYHLPFPDGSFDIVYARAFVHHLSDKIAFLREVYRVLRTGGICVFGDDALSTLWQFWKLTGLKALMKYTHRKRGISPEDLRHTLEGGFIESDVRLWGKGAGFENYFYDRHSLLNRLWTRGTFKLFGLVERNKLKSSIALLLKHIDTQLSSKFRFYHDNTLNLVWGYRKTAIERREFFHKLAMKA